MLRRAPGGTLAGATTRVDAQLAGPNVVRATADLSFMTYRYARPLCERIEAVARDNGADGLVMDMSSLSKASPRAGGYAIVRLKTIPLRRIALVGGSRFMRGFASTVLTLGRFPAFRFFDSEPEALRWAAGPEGEG